MQRVRGKQGAEKQAIEAKTPSEGVVGGKTLMAGAVVGILTPPHPRGLEGLGEVLQTIRTEGKPATDGLKGKEVEEGGGGGSAGGQFEDAQQGIGDGIQAS